VISDDKMKVINDKTIEKVGLFCPRLGFRNKWQLQMYNLYMIDENNNSSAKR